MVEGLSLGTVERLLSEAGYELADLVETREPADEGEHRADETA